MNTQMYLRDDPDQQNLIDWIQEGWLQCCGIEGPTVSLIFKNLILKIFFTMITCSTYIHPMLQDWDKNIYFNCSSEAVGSREACGVPFRFFLFPRFWNLLVISFLISLCFLFNLYICPVASPVLRCSVGLLSDFLYIIFICCTSSVAASPRTTNWSRTSSAAMTSGSRTMWVSFSFVFESDNFQWTLSSSDWHYYYNYCEHCWYE